MIQQDRIKALNTRRAGRGSYVLYWMQASQRAECNHALEHAVREANQRGEPVLVYFGITDTYPEARERHYHFMLEGLREVRTALQQRGIGMITGHESPEKGVVRWSKRASLVVCDRGYLRIQRQWRSAVARAIQCPLIQVETDVVVPVEVASPREEYSAATMRPKVRRPLSQYLVPLEEQGPRIASPAPDSDSFSVDDVEKAVSSLDIDRGVKPVEHIHGGTAEARRHLDSFLNSKLDRYAILRNDANADCVSNLSPYLHFGQISPLYVALKVRETGSPSADAYLEELIVRRELSMNYVFYNESYDSFGGLPGWARNTLYEHSSDRREYAYTLEQLEAGATHDPYWNAAQREMAITGKMHGYMRMYWGKKILEWSGTPEEAFRRCLYLNNKYELDGRDPNSFAGVAWCFGKHDRPWARRPIFGSVRYMSAAGLRRKFDADWYADRYTPKAGDGGQVH